jgi:hypothetical protein
MLGCDAIKIVEFLLHGGVEVIEVVVRRVKSGGGIGAGAIRILLCRICCTGVDSEAYRYDVLHVSQVMFAIGTAFDEARERTPMRTKGPCMFESLARGMPTEGAKQRAG